jgi:hypothetical protein
VSSWVAGALVDTLERALCRAPDRSTSLRPSYENPYARSYGNLYDEGTTMDLTTRPDGSIRLDVPASYAPTLGADGMLLLDWFSSALIALARLRDPQEMTPNDWHNLINDVERRLTPRMQGIRDALIRAHAAAGGSYGDLALAMDTGKSTAQYRRDRLTDVAPSHWERWATGTLPGYTRTDWTAQVFLVRPDTAPGRAPGDEIREHVELTDLTAEQARELETLLTTDPDHTVTIGARTFSAPEVQMVTVSRTAARHTAH